MLLWMLFVVNSEFLKINSIYKSNTDSFKHIKAVQSCGKQYSSQLRMPVQLLYLLLTLMDE